MRSDLRKLNLATADESPLQVIVEAGRSAYQKSWMWLFTSSAIARPILIYKYDPSRAGPVPKKMFGKNFKGHLMTDAFSAYNIFNAVMVKLLGCWSHVRRKFKKAFDDSKSELSGKFLFIIQKLYYIEKQLKESNADENEILKTRLRDSVPLLESFHNLLLEYQSKITAGGLLGKALSYALNNWDRMTKYAYTGHLPIDNNFTENYFRPFVVGRPRTSMYFAASMTSCHWS